MEKAAFDKERKEVYNSFGGKPEYEENLLVFGSVVSGSEVIKAIENNNKKINSIKLFTLFLLTF